MTDVERDLHRRAIAALLWIAAFCFATGIFLSSTLLLRGIPPTPHVAVGRVTIENVSKTREYATAALFFVIVPLATWWLYGFGSKMNERLRASLSWRRNSEPLQDLVSLLFVGPFFLAPFLYLTTFKWGWPLLIPLTLSQVLPRTVIAVQRISWLRRLLAADMAPYHALVLSEGLAWILFRYIATARRIAHIPTLFLEVVFVFLFVLIFWGAITLIARLATFVLGADFEVAFKRLAIAPLPLIVLPFMALAFIPAWISVSVAMVAVFAAIGIAVRGGDVEPAARVRAIAAYVVLPVLLYCFGYASMANATQWLDLFHRGESFGPASDYLRGKVPYRDVFILHGLLMDGQLDAWLMQLFGRDISVALARPVILGAFASPALWYLGMAIFDSMPLAAVTIFLGSVTTEHNERTLFEIAVLALVVAGVRSRTRPFVLFAAGLFAALALFFSYDIGLYSVGGTVLFLLIGRRFKAIVPFVAGVAAGSLPFLVYLGFRGALGAFAQTTFITVPKIIDAAWSLPFPDLTATFRSNLSLRTLTDFFISDNFRFVLTPLVIGLAATALLCRAVKKTNGWLDVALLAVTAFAALTERSALGRADAPHQYFSAFLTGPLILVLLVMLARAAAPMWRDERGSRPFIMLAVVAAMPLLFIALWVPDVLNYRLDSLLNYQPRVTGAVRDPIAEEVKGRIESVRYHVFDLTPKGSAIFDFSNQPAFYFFLDRPNPTRFYQVPILSPAVFQRETIEALERAKPPLVIRRSPQGFDSFDGVDNTVRAQAVAAYIDDHYAYARSVRGVELWKRKPGARGATTTAYLKLIHVPTAKETAATGARSRLLFPSVGSTPGANGAFWRSDLVIRNPFKDPIVVSLRYVAGDTRIDRPLTLPGGKMMRFDDVVKTLFRAPDSFGVLWIDYRGERGPAARVQTYDANRVTSGTVESPLSARDAATSGSDADALTIFGLRGGGPAARRINVGVVNIGQIPATFRVSVRTRSGKEIGHPVEQGLPEDESVQVIDIETALGVAIDETDVVEVSMIAGTCVGYASVVGTDGTNQIIAGTPSPRM